MEIVSIIGMVAALALLSFLVMKGVNIFIAAIVSSLLVAITGQIGLYDALQNDYMSGFTSFFGSNFLIFVAGALMGQVYEKTNGAKAIARLMLGELQDVLREKDIQLTYDDALVDYLTEKSYSLTYGARNLRRLIQKEIEDRIASEMIDNRHSDVQRIGLTAKDGAVQILAV